MNYFLRSFSMEGLLVYGQNVNGLRTRTAEFRLSSLAVGADLYLITESNLCAGICDSEVFDLSQYSVFRRDRESSFCSVNKKSGGGVMIGVRSSIRTVHQEHLQSEAEDLWITLQINEHFKIHVCVVYLPPRNDKARTCFTENLQRNLGILGGQSIIVYGPL